jgi:alginate O-acetyltransferase complex protein AlgI
MTGLDADAIANSDVFSLLSSKFLLFSSLAILASSIGRRFQNTYGLVLLALNFTFFWMVGSSLTSLIAVLLFVHVAYALVVLQRRTSTVWTKYAAVAGIAGFWVILFLIKNPDVFGRFSPTAFLDATIIGISYLAFRAISAIMDAPDLDGVDYISFMNYMMFFPTLLAGPIERYEPFRAYHISPEPAEIDVALAACKRITLGFVKKFVLADNLAPLGIFAFGPDPQSAPTSVLWLGVLLQLTLIFLDFSGYCDIMIGIARLMGFRIQENFDKPYLARNIQEFWNRWHMSLTYFVRDYVFTPICKFIFWRVDRSKQFPYVAGTYFFTMLVIALWHKLSWGFLLFGVMHGTALVLLQIKRRYADKSSWAKTAAGAALIKPPLPIAVALTWSFFAISTVAWYFPPSTTWAIVLKLAGVGL